MKIIVINGPNLNLLGKREKHIYGDKTLNDLSDLLSKEANKRDIKFEMFQSNSEGEIIDRLHEAEHEADGVILNPAAYTHYSIAIRDAIASISLPVIEVHLSNIHGREDFRRISVTASSTIGQISGLGFMGYLLAFWALIENMEEG